MEGHVNGLLFLAPPFTIVYVQYHTIIALEIGFKMEDYFTCTLQVNVEPVEGNREQERLIADYFVLWLNTENNY